eukprot:422981_1
MSITQPTSSKLTPSKPKNVNDQYKSLHLIFQTQLHQYVTSNNKEKFDAVTQELGFNNTQKEFLFDAIQTSATHPYPPRNPTPNPNPQTNGHSPSQSPFYAIPTHHNRNTNSNNKSKKKIKTKNKKISGRKRRRNAELNEKKTKKFHIYSSDSSSVPSESDIDTEFSDYKASIEPSKKRHKSNKIQKIKEDDLTAEKMAEMEENNIYVVEEIIDHREIGTNKYKYNVKWERYDDLTWEPKTNLTDESIKKYWKSKGYKMDKYGIVKKINSKKNVSKKISKEKKKPKKVLVKDKSPKKSVKKKKNNLY